MGSVLLTAKQFAQSGIDFIRRKFGQMIKFAGSSSIATAIDYGLYLFLVGQALSPVVSNIISATTGFLVNFLLQKKFIFALNRKTHHALGISAMFSGIGIALSTTLIWLFIKIPFLEKHQYITKLIVIGIVFFYNFFTKRFAFERRAFK